MKYPFKKKDETLDTYIFNLKETCIVEHEDNWFKEKSHTKLYPNIEEAKLKISKLRDFKFCFLYIWIKFGMRFFFKPVILMLNDACFF